MATEAHSIPFTVSAAVALLCAVVLAGSAHAAPREFRETEAGRSLAPLLEKDPAALRARLEPLRARFEGDPAFDMLFARAALATGERELARLALERVRFVAPRTPGARALSLALQGGAVEAPTTTAAWQEPELEAVDRSALASLDALLERRDWEGAWIEARELRAAWEGDPGFDYLFGIAALEAGHPDEALFSLQRVLFFDPDQIRVRAQLARAHFVGGDLDQAEAEFRRVLEGAPPPAVAGSIQGYMDEIDRLRSARSPRLLARLDFRAGWDDNVNGATSDAVVSTPVGDFELGENGRALSSPFTESALNLVYEHPLSRRRTVDLVLAATLRHNFDQHDFDLDVYRLEAGLAEEEGARRIRGALRGTVVMLGDDRFQQSAGAGVALEWNPGRWRLGLDLDATVVRYPEDGRRDVTQLLGALRGTYLRPRDLLTVGVFAGTELALEGDGEFNGRDLAGFSAAWQRSALPGHVPYVRYRLLAARHHADHPVFAERRRDLRQTAAVGWNWFVADGIAARAELDYTETRSSLDLFDQDRLRIETGLSYRF